jgi:hypothetical protein
VPWSPSTESPCLPRYGADLGTCLTFSFPSKLKDNNDSFLLELWADFSSLWYFQLMRGSSFVCDFALDLSGECCARMHACDIVCMKTKHVRGSNLRQRKAQLLLKLY